MSFIYKITQNYRWNIVERDSNDTHAFKQKCFHILVVFLGFYICCQVFWIKNIGATEATYYMYTVVLKESLYVKTIKIGTLYKDAFIVY
jgi:hypothetical protein